MLQQNDNLTSHDARAPEAPRQALLLSRFTGAANPDIGTVEFGEIDHELLAQYVEDTGITPHQLVKAYGGSVTGDEVQGWLDAEPGHRVDEAKLRWVWAAYGHAAGFTDQRPQAQAAVLAIAS